jgi:hypothetical protein
VDRDDNGDILVGDVQNVYLPERVRACLGELHTAPDPTKQLHSIFFPAKHINSKNSRSTKSIDLAPNSTKSMECLKGYSAKACFVLTRGVG